MSLTRIKIAFDEAMRDASSDPFAMFLSALIREAGGETLHVYVPTQARNIELERRQGELFDSGRCAGLTIREIAEAVGVSKDRVHRHLSQGRTVSATAA